MCISARMPGCRRRDHGAGVVLPLRVREAEEGLDKDGDGAKAKSNGGELIPHWMGVFVMRIKARITCIHIVRDVMCIGVIVSYSDSFVALDQTGKDRIISCAYTDVQYRRGSLRDRMSGPYSPQWATKTKKSSSRVDGPAPAVSAIPPSPYPREEPKETAGTTTVV